MHINVICLQGQISKDMYIRVYVYRGGKKESEGKKYKLSKTRTEPMF